ncbi:hypothetical protein [Mesorhizobium sp.]|uniref:hypothetical protein n=1 Tax=Mesorhizobium sp. TaxID=1871066 RepID=UPI0012103EEE|nr:hypothetical protein [Mesorhizobium sp.]TIS87128.1 MAG: hypothetical protein E5W89_26215 [Mesorhizobium sp.]
MAGVYPQAALVMAAVIGMTAFTPWRSPLVDFSRRQLALIAIAAVATVVGVAPFLLRANQFGPVFTLAEARNIPTFLYEQRGAVFEPDGSVDLLCQKRIGIFAAECSGLLDPWLALLVLVNFAGPIFLFARMFRPGPPFGSRSPLPLFLLVSSLMCAALSAAVMFRLHVPNRYASVLRLLPYLATLPVLFDWIRSRLSPQALIERYHGRTLLIGTCIVMTVCVLAVSIVHTSNKSPANRELISAIRALPKDAVVGGFVDDLDFSPVLTQRSTLFSRELSVAYEKGYYQPVYRRMEIVRDIVLATDAIVLLDRMQYLPIDCLIVAKETLVHPRVPTSFRGFFGADLLDMETQAAQNGPTLVARLAQGCTTGVYRDVVMLSMRCLLQEATHDLDRQRTRGAINKDRSAAAAATTDPSSVGSTPAPSTTQP